METVSRLVVASGMVEWWVLMGIGFLMEVMKCSKATLVMVAQLREFNKIIELYTLKEWIIWYVN